MANSKAIITFTSMPTLNQVFHLHEATMGLDIMETFKAQRLGLKQTKLPPATNIGTIGSPVYVYSGFVAQNFRDAFNLDYNATGLFDILFIGTTPNGLGQVVITANYPGAVFEDTNTLSGVEVTILNVDGGEQINIDNVDFVQADTNPCQNINATVTTDVLATKVTGSLPIAAQTQASSNMLLYSGNLSNAAWTKELASITGNKVKATNSFGYHTISQVVNKGSSAGEFTFSAFIKASEYNIVELQLSENIGSGQFFTAFNVSTQTFLYQFGLSGYTYISSAFTDEGDGFFRVSVKVGVTAYANVKVKVNLRDSGGSDAFTGNNSDGIYIDKLQFQEGDLTPYLATTSTALSVPFSDGTVIDPNTDNPFTILGLRGSTIDLTVENADGNTDTETIVFPSILSESNFALNIISSPNGSNVSISNTNTFGLDLQYSLDGTTWQNSNVFSGLMADDYTLYVKDQYGCSFQKDFTITDSNIYIPQFYISKSNSIRYAQRIEWGDAANYKTDENTLSCEVDALQKFKQIQLFQSADVITTQFKSNYATNTAKIIRTGFADVDVPVVKKTNNIGVTDMRDARMYNLGDGTSGIYFLAGNTYDYNTMTVNGSHALNGLLPEWGVIGNYVNIDSAWYIIENVIFDESKNADVLVINQIYTGSEVSKVVGCIYNAFDYEVYEFDIDMSVYLNQNIRVKILNEDPNFQTVEHLSEEINVAVRQEDTLDIHYWNPTNNDVFYETGIRYRIRMPYTKIEGQPDEDSSIHKTDATAILLSAQLYEGDKFIFEPTTKELWRKLMAALSHKFVFINGVQYVKNGDFETDGPLEDSNLYVLKVTMTKAGTVYNSDGSTFGMGNSSQVEIPGLLEGDNGFISY